MPIASLRPCAHPGCSLSCKPASARSRGAEAGRMRPQAVQPKQLVGEGVGTPARGVLCEGCGAEFTPRRASQRFCRPACRPRAQRRRKREWLQQALPDDPGRAE